MSTQRPVDPQAAKGLLIDAIMDIEHPMWRLHEALTLIKAAQNIAETPSQTSITADTQAITARKAALQALDMDDLQQLHATVKAEKDRKNEAARFYNQANAIANYRYWLALDFWTLDEAIALLLCRNPEIVTWNAVNQAMRPPKKFMGPAPVSTPFLQRFERLRHAAQRSEVMTASAKLKPLVVAQWGQRLLGAELPMQLQALLDAAPPAVQAIPERPPKPTVDPVDKAPTEPVLVKRKALLARKDIWPTVDSDLRNAKANKLHDAAKSDVYSMWKEHEALEWARRNGKLVNDGPTPTSGILDRHIHRMER